MTADLPRCPWCSSDPRYLAYHDEEWGVPLHGDRALFELLVLEGAQAGLSWLTVLRKRAHYRRVFAGFDPARIARGRPARIEKLLADPGIIRNRAKVEGAVASAQAFLRLAEREGGFDHWLWQFVGGQPLVNRFASLPQVPAETAASRAMSKALRRVGFTFCGPTICYAFMQAAGMVNDHLLTCFRHPDHPLFRPEVRSP